MSFPICLIISLKNSKRRKYLINRLKKINLNYKIIDGINGKELSRKKELSKYYNSSTPKKIGRLMSPGEIGAAASHLKAYKFIVKNKIKKAVILEDDAIPSLEFKNMLKKINFNLNDNILSFFAYPSGYLNKKPFKKKFYKDVNIYKSLTHIHSASCHLINLKTAKKILKITSGKVINYADWPFNTIKDGINLFVTIPFTVVINDRGYSNTSKERNLILNIKDRKKTNIFIKKIINFLKIIYYLSFIPIFLRKYKDTNFYLEHFFFKNYYRLKNLFYHSETDLYKISYDKNYYIDDLKNEFQKVSKYL